jgi:hypothetical protein
MGLLDWITDGGGSLFADGGTPMMPGSGSQMGETDPLGNATGTSMPLPTAASAPTQPMPPMQDSNPAASPPPPLPTSPPVTATNGYRGPGDSPLQPDELNRPTPPPVPPSQFAAGTDPVTAGGVPFAAGTDPMIAGGVPPNGGLPPPPPPQTATPPAARPTQGAIPPPPPETPPGAPMSLAPQMAQNAPPSGLGPPDMQGRSGLLSAMGLSSDVANRMRGGLGAGLKAAGNSAGKSPMQALAGGAGESMEGGQKASDENNKQTQGYLKNAIDAKAKGDEAGYKQNYLKYLAAKLKADTDNAAGKNAASKNDSPTQLYLRARSEVSKDSEVRGSQKVLEGVIKNGTPEEITQAQAKHAALVQQKQQEAYAGLGLHPQTIAQIAQQPGNSEGNPIDGKKAGLTQESIKKLEPGQFYTNPKDGKLYQYKGNGQSASTQVKGIPDRPTTPEPADPLNPGRGTLPKSSQDDED